MQTIKQIKNRVPFEIQVSINGCICTGVVKGRKLQFAKVIIHDTCISEYAWETIASVVNNGGVLIA